MSKFGGLKLLSVVNKCVYLFVAFYSNILVFSSDKTKKIYCNELAIIEMKTRYRYTITDIEGKPRYVYTRTDEKEWTADEVIDWIKRVGPEKFVSLSGLKFKFPKYYNYEFTDVDNEIKIIDKTIKINVFVRKELKLKEEMKSVLSVDGGSIFQTPNYTYFAEDGKKKVKDLIAYVKTNIFNGLGCPVDDVNYKVSVRYFTGGSSKECTFQEAEKSEELCSTGVFFLRYEKVSSGSDSKPGSEDGSESGETDSNSSSSGSNSKSKKKRCGCKCSGK